MKVLNSRFSRFRFHLEMSRTTGGAWRKLVSFYSKSEKPSSALEYVIKRDWLCSRSAEEWLCDNRGRGHIYLIDHDLLVQTMSLLIDFSENILNIWVFKSPLSDWQRTQLFLNHQFVVIKTKNWWWSIEKNSEVILIQRSKHFKGYGGVLDYANNNKRKTPLLRVSSDVGQKTMKDLIEFLHEEDELNKTYFWNVNNCKHFAKKIYDEFAKRTLHDITLGCDLRGNKKTMEVSECVWHGRLLKKRFGVHQMLFDSLK